MKLSVVYVITKKLKIRFSVLCITDGYQGGRRVRRHYVDVQGRKGVG